MATKIYLRTTTTHPNAYPQANYFDMLVAQGASVTTTSATAVQADGERYFRVSAQTTPAGWWSERFASEVTISGAISFSLWALATSGSTTTRVRARLYKITFGGSNIETLIGQADSSTNIAVGASPNRHQFTLTPTVAVTCAPNERLILRVSVFESSGGAMSGSPIYNLYLNASGADTTSGTSNLSLTETVTMKANGVTLYQRRLTTIGIGNFMDLALAQFVGTQAEATAVVNTQTGAAPLDIQWTKTAGGAVAEWISPRFKYAWTVVAGSFSHNMHCSESATTANAAPKAKVFVRRADGTEILLATWVSNTEMGTSLTPYFDSPTTNWTLDNAVSIYEDDRIILRNYIHPGAQTMASGRTCTLGYDVGNTSGAFGTLVIRDSSEFKAESDPAASPVVPGGMTMLGLGNGQ